MKPKLPNFVILLVLTTLTAVMWAGLSIYRSFSVKPSPIVSEEILKPINPVLDQTIIEEIERRKMVEVAIEEPVSEIDEINLDNTDTETENVDDLNIDDFDSELEL